MAKNFGIIHLTGGKTVLSGLTRISRNKTDTQFEIRPTYYTLRVECENFKSLTSEMIELAKPILELAFDSMAIRSSSYLIDRADTEAKVQELLGKVTRVEPTEKVKVVTFTGGKLECKYAELYAKVKQEAKPLDVNTLSDEAAKELMAKLMKRLQGGAGAEGTDS